MKKQRRSDGGGAPPPTDAPAPAVHEDPRFAAVHSNPRFARFPKARFLGKCGRVVTVQLTQRGRQAKSKVEIDQRFSGVFSDPKFKRQTVVDKRGRATGAKCVMAATAAACCKRSRGGAGSAPTTCDASTAFQMKKLPELRRELSRRRLDLCAQAAAPSRLRMLRLKKMTMTTTPALVT